MLRALTKKKSQAIYAQLVAVDAETLRLTTTNCASKKTVKSICMALRSIGLLEEFATYAMQVAAVRADATDWPKCKCGAAVSMFNGLFRTFCSRACSLASEATKSKSKQTCMMRYGVTHQWAAGPHRNAMISRYVEEHGISPQAMGRDKRLATWQTKYGCHPMQTEAIFKKAMRARMMIKSAQLPSGRKVDLMGHEPHALAYVLREGIWHETDFDFENLPIVKYGNKRYFPDLWIPSHNLLIEVKSNYTAFAKRYLDCNIAKENAVKQLGYNFQLWVWDPKTKTLQVAGTFKRR